MPFHSDIDIETMFDPDMGDGYEATITPVSGDPYTINVLRDKNVDKVDQFGNISEKVTLVHFITSQLHDGFGRGTVASFDSRDYRIETLHNQDTYVSTYEVS
ncbi:hypothetical protein [Pseudohongiella nitratireducens]|uniref:hypothetical protein n=1 Tax=Pseudohongiella nitratireducens TaxID=1768907 RepID=UPI0030EC10E3|tara:strand:+ start:1067 stop:1372 length:306 start_codon:yes stop_codon:yes gene_type:complete